MIFEPPIAVFCFVLEITIEIWAGNNFLAMRAVEGEAPLSLIGGL